MELKCMINGITYDESLVQGLVFKDEYSETLDSASIIIAYVEKINDLDAYDDVYIWDAEHNFTGISSVTNDFKFYKHFLIDRFTEERNLLDRNSYTYKIELFSETKGLETIALPNVNVTHPLKKENQLSTITYMEHFLELYSPKIKVTTNGSTWSYEQKYTLSDQVRQVFANHYCQQFSLNNPTLRELFTKLMVSKDCIPYVKDNKIYALEISKNRGTFTLDNAKKSFIVANKTSDNYATQLRTSYSNALVGKPTCRRVEQLGFRNSDEAIMTIRNMRVETSFPIYKLNRVYVCYYKRVRATFYPDNGHPNLDGGTKSDFYFLCKQDITELCVLNNERQALYKDTRVASNKTNPFDDMKENYYFTVGYSIGSNLITGFGEMFNYVTRSLNNIYDKEECIIRNIINNMDRLYPYGILNQRDVVDLIKRFIGVEPSQLTFPSSSNGVSYKPVSFSDIESSNGSGNGTVPTLFIDTELGDTLKNVHYWLQTAAKAVDPTGSTLLMVNAANSLVSGLSSSNFTSTAIKGLTFEIDYEAFYNGAVITQKPTLKNQITKIDNQSDSMPFLNLDGVARERKLLKMGNKEYTITARYDSFDDVQEVGTVFNYSATDENQTDDEKVIIYHREMTLKDKAIDVTYFGQEEFILKNYYTSVFAKQRLYNILDYGQSIVRANNYSDIILASKTKKFKDKQFNVTTFKNNRYSFSLKDYLTFNKTISDNEVSSYKINKAYMRFTTSTLNYLIDLNAFTYGLSLCFNFKMVDNITMGQAIDIYHLYGSFWDGLINSDTNKNFAGTSLMMNTVYDDYQTGRISQIDYALGTTRKVEENFGGQDYYEQDDELGLTIYSNANPIGASSSGVTLNTTTTDSNETVCKAWLNLMKKETQKLLLPACVDEYLPMDVKLETSKNVYKDTNEEIDITLQTQLIVDKKDRENVFFSDWLFKLSDLYGMYSKQDKTISRTVDLTDKVFVLPFQIRNILSGDVNATHFGLLTRVPSDALYYLVKQNAEFGINTTFKFVDDSDNLYNGAYTNSWINNFEITIDSLTFIDDNCIRVNCSYTKAVIKDSLNGSTLRTITKDYSFFYLFKIDNYYIKDTNNINQNKYSYFSNVSFIVNTDDVSIHGKQIIPSMRKYFKETERSQDTYTWYEPAAIPQLEGCPTDFEPTNIGFYGYESSGNVINYDEYYSDIKAIGDGIRTPTGYAGLLGQMSCYMPCNVVTVNNVPTEDWDIPRNSGVINVQQGTEGYENMSGNFKRSSPYAPTPPNPMIYTETFSTVANNEFNPIYQHFDALYNYHSTHHISYSRVLSDMISIEQVDEEDMNPLICVVSNQRIDNSLIDVKLSNFADSLNEISFIQTEELCEDVFKVVADNDKSYGALEVDLDTLLNDYPNIQSVQEWYYNKEAECYEFVCGFNISDEEKTARKITLNLSILGNQDLRVFRDGVLVGKIKNIADSEYNSNDEIDAL